ncbi:hypothetical protein SMICM17S_00987 [Streptomyces microflavus]
MVAAPDVLDPAAQRPAVRLRRGGHQGILGESWPEDLAGPLWYIRAYLWSVLFSPLLLRCLRKLPWPTLLAPLALSVVMRLELFSTTERLDSAITDFSTFGACWVLGMAHQEGVLKRLPAYIVPSIAPLFAGAGLWWASHEGFRSGFDLDSIPLAQALWSLGRVLLLLHYSPSWTEWPRRLRAFDRPITLLNSRAVTVYLWHNFCILTAATLYDRLWSVDALSENVPWLLESWIPVLLVTWALIALCVLAFGWAEDVAAKRRPQLWPDGRKLTASHRAGNGPVSEADHRSPHGTAPKRALPSVGTTPRSDGDTTPTPLWRRVIAGTSIESWEPEDETFWREKGERVARRNLWFCVLSEHIGSPSGPCGR